MANPETIKAGELEIKYLMDGAAKGGMGVFELTIPTWGKGSPTA